MTGVNAACSVALSLDADVIVTSTSDVYGDGTPPYREDGQLVIGPPTSKRWAYAVSKMYDEHHALALADERGLKVTILRLFNVYGPRNHLTWWGGPTVTFIEALLNGEAARSTATACRRGASPTSRTRSTASCARCETPESRGEVVNIGSTDSLSIRCLAEKIQEQLEIPQPLRATFIGYDEMPGNYQDVRHRVPGHDEGARAARLRGEGLARRRAWSARSSGTASSGCSTRGRRPGPETGTRRGPGDVRSRAATIGILAAALAALVLPRRLAGVPRPRRVDTGRASTTRRACSSCAASDDEAVDEMFEGPLVGRAAHARPRAHRQPGVGRVQRAVLRAARGGAARRRRALPAGRGALAPLPLARRLRRGGPGSLRPAAPALPDRDRRDGRSRALRCCRR